MRGSLRKELADGVGISGLQTACDGTRLAIADPLVVHAHGGIDLRE